MDSAMSFQIDDAASKPWLQLPSLNDFGVGAPDIFAVLFIIGVPLAAGILMVWFATARRSSPRKRKH
jgi:hypothetical protein